jgi:hypothetical protein
MQVLRLLYAELKDAWHRWELRHINPLSPHVHSIVLERQRLADMLRR